MTALPAEGRTYLGLLSDVHPEVMSGGLTGTFTHWYPDGSIESNGTYVESGTTSLPDGVWGFWYPDGRRRIIGRYDHGHPVGCFALWDEQGNQATGIVDANQLRLELCEPPIDSSILEAEQRANPRGRRETWGDLAVHLIMQAGAFGASNPTQQDPNPSAFGTVQAVLRKRIGPLRLGPTLGLRLSNSDDVRAYTAGIATAYQHELFSGLAIELEAQLGLEYIEITARRMGTPGLAGHTGFGAPTIGGRLWLTYALSSKLELVGGASYDTAFGTSNQDVAYCAGGCDAPIPVSGAT